MPKFDWKVNARKTLMVFINGGLVAIATQASLIPDSVWAGMLTSLHVPPQIALPLVLVGLPALKSAANWLKNR